MRSPPSGTGTVNTRACQELLHLGDAGQDAIAALGWRAASGSAVRPTTTLRLRARAAPAQRTDGVLVADVVTSRFWNCQP